ncbi:hypothetical protein NTE_01910 [Candidatus Nitrososphaera evergladensis SR1]|uniref:Archaeal coiled-coil protein n=1 Tax=Candidatus Nitrososphaera evergladensis SR1 TaxID=1459636 RepID=A0A075MXD7_9ARCH|nr:hypothetical protein [Candidatus Nitrososphaera evergladensis]AIF83969.1 hypothetical protein NTE_01910 [Candidatus Nitrososphaera evergladensis SR1]
MEADGKALESLGWEDLVTLKRKVAGDLKSVTDRLVDIDRNQFRAIVTAIKTQKTALDSVTERARQVRAEVDKRNSDLLSISEKISQSKNFLSMMEARLPAEKEEELQAIVASNQALVDAKQYKGEREKGEILSKIKDASMKMEAIKAIRTIKDQYVMLTQQSADIGNAVKALNDERDALRVRTAEINVEMDKLYDAKRKLAAERNLRLAEYEDIVKHFDAINARLDEMSAMRKRQREEYGYNLPSDALFKVKETARKKLESGSKLSLDELRLLYSEKD